MWTSPIFLLLVVALAVLLLLWRRNDDVRFRNAAAVVAVLLLLWIGWQLLGPESPARQMQRKTEAMAAAIQTRNLDALFEHVSDEFRYGPMDKARLRTVAERYLGSGELGSIEVWDFRDAKVQPASGNEKPSATIQFTVKPKGRDIPDVFFRCASRWVQEADGQWRIVGFDLYRMPGNQPFSPPMFPAR
ncbi:MAG: hypothetical protein JNM56_15390 [Planctomycetia bacterium]|nr:hypothetical protein [Planctomycetia bacterium]